MKALIALPLISLLISSGSTQAGENILGALSVLLSERQVQLVKEQYSDPAGWHLVSEDSRLDDGDSDSAVAEIVDNLLKLSADAECGNPHAQADRIITNPVETDNIKWVIKFDFMLFDKGRARLLLNYWGINIQIDLTEGTVPFDVYNGVEDVMLVVRFKNGVLGAKINGESLRTPYPQALRVTTSTDLSSNIHIRADASAADCGASSRIRVRSIIASSSFDV